MLAATAQSVTTNLQEDLYHIQETMGQSLQEMQQADPTLQDVARWVETQTKPTREEAARMSAMHLAYQGIYKCLQKRDDG